MSRDAVDHEGMARCDGCYGYAYPDEICDECQQCQDCCTCYDEED